MLHELLFALHGCPGSVIVLNKSGKLRLTEELPFVSASEIPIMNRLCLLGSYYREVQEFIRKHSHYIGKNSSIYSGLYMKCFCDGLDSALHSYRCRLQDLEHELQCDPFLSLSYIQCRVEEFHLIFPSLHDLLVNLEDSGTRGIQILDKIVHLMPLGFPSVKEIFDNILQYCHRILYRQLSSWMLRGVLFDPYQEFFIVKSKESKETNVLDSDEFGRTMDDDPDSVIVKGASRHQLTRLMNGDGFIKKNKMTKFELRLDYLPSYIPLVLAQRILFIGESVHCFNRTSSDCDFLAELESQFASRLLDLSRSPSFDLLLAEEVVHSIKNHVTEALWHLIVEEHDLESQLKLSKDYFLMGRGELFLSFIELASPLLSTTPGKHVEVDLNTFFQRAARLVLLEDESNLSRFSISFNSDLATASSGWRGLGLKYKFDWPFHIIFTPNILDNYNTLFQFFLTVKRVQYSLQQCWAIQMLTKREYNNRTRSLSPHFLLRSHMQYLMDNLTYYLQVDVIDSQFNELLKTVKQKKDIESVQFALQRFLANLLSQSFIRHKLIYSTLMKIFDSCLKFTNLLKNSLDSLNDNVPLLLNQMNSIQSQFYQDSWQLLNILGNVQKQLQSSPYLVQLLLRLDFNKFFSSSASPMMKYSKVENLVASHSESGSTSVSQSSSTRL